MSVYELDDFKAIISKWDLLIKAENVILCSYPSTMKTNYSATIHAIFAVNQREMVK